MTTIPTTGERIKIIPRDNFLATVEGVVIADNGKPDAARLVVAWRDHRGDTILALQARQVGLPQAEEAWFADCTYNLSDGTATIDDIVEDAPLYFGELDEGIIRETLDLL